MFMRDVYRSLPRAIRRPVREIRQSIAGRRIAYVPDSCGIGIKMHAERAGPFLSGDYEPPVRRALMEHLRPGMVFYDVGANVGYFSLLAAAIVTRSGTVYAFEPVAKNVKA